MVLSNETNNSQNFELNLSLVFPNTMSIPLISSKPLSMPAWGNVSQTINLPLSDMLPPLTFGVAASLIETGSGITISESFLSFDVD